MSQCTYLAVHSCTENIKCSGERRKWGGPQSRRANALPATGEKLKIEGKCGLVVFGRKRSERGRGRKRAFVIFFFQVKGSCSVEMQRCCGGNLMTNAGSMICELVD